MPRLLYHVKLTSAPRWLIAVLWLLCISPSGFAQPSQADYLRDIRPLLKTKCWSCHGAVRQEGGLRLDTVRQMRIGGDSGPAIDERDGLASLILQRVSADDENRMPPEGQRLTHEQLIRLQIWLKAGAPAPEDERPQPAPGAHWAFQPVRRPEVPASVHPVDYFINLRRESAGINAPPPADAGTVIRRMFLDLHGLPPTPEETDFWLPRLSGTPDDAEGHVQRLIDILLASPRYGERWAQHWLDLVRYADTHGYEVNTPRPNAWPYRDYVIRAFNEDRTYQQFIIDQIAGDMTGEDAATGFLVAAAALLPGQIGADDASKRQARQDELDEIIVGTTATFLGLTVGCARCHDHKFDPVPTADYYALQAFFAGVRYGDRPVQDAQAAARLAQAERLEPQIRKLRQELRKSGPPAFTGRTILIDDEDENRVSVLAARLSYGVNPAGKSRGYRDDPGDETRFGNLSGGRYSWWQNQPGKDVLAYHPGQSGRFRIWISWGVHGSGVHTRDARYVLDMDGNLQTTSDQTEIARADQYLFSGQADGSSEKKPLWSGLCDVGVYRLNDQSRLVVRGGDTGTGITADVVVFQEVPRDAASVEQHLPLLRAPVSAEGNTEFFPSVRARYVRFTCLETSENNRYEPCLDELEVFTAEPDSRNVAAAQLGVTASSSGNYSNTGKHQLAHINDQRYGNSYSWISSEKGRGWVQLDLKEVHTINRIDWARDRTGQFKDRLPVRYRIEVSVDNVNWMVVSVSDDRLPLATPDLAINSVLRRQNEASGKRVRQTADRLQQLEKEQQELRAPRMAFAGIFEQPQATFVLRRGDPEQKEREILPHVPTALGTLQLPGDATDRERRFALARWIASPSNPLTARVMVNRIWQYHFGTGLVETPSDFGMNGGPPSHPLLLDWLAAELIENDWSVKHLHRVIMSSAAFRQSAAVSMSFAEEAKSKDAGNRLLWRFPSRRLEAEAIRDSILFVSGELNLQPGGPGFNFFKSRGGLSGFPPVTEFTTAEKRRMIYAHKIRMERVPLFGAFDCPDAGLPTPKRSLSTTAIQALNLFNGPFVLQQSAAFAERILAQAPDSVSDQVTTAFRLALGRRPTQSERAVVLPLVRQHGLQALCRALFNSNEFLYLP